MSHKCTVGDTICIQYLVWSFKVSGVCVYVIGLKLNFRCHYLEKYLVLEIGKHYGLTSLLSSYTYIYLHTH